MLLFAVGLVFYWFHAKDLAEWIYVTGCDSIVHVIITVHLIFSSFMVYVTAISKVMVLY